MPFEILGTSVYDYIHEDDLTVYAKAHESRKLNETTDKWTYIVWTNEQTKEETNERTKERTNKLRNERTN